MIKVQAALINSGEYLPLEKVGKYYRFQDKDTWGFCIKSPVENPWLITCWEIALHIDTGKNRSGVRYSKSLVLQLIKPVSVVTHQIVKVVERANFPYVEESAIAFYSFPIFVTKNSGSKWATYFVMNN